jgi:hypothetical protein
VVTDATDCHQIASAALSKNARRTRAGGAAMMIDRSIVETKLADAMIGSCRASTPDRGRIVPTGWGCGGRE